MIDQDPGMKKWSSDYTMTTEYVCRLKILVCFMLYQKYAQYDHPKHP